MNDKRYLAIFLEHDCPVFFTGNTLGELKGQIDFWSNNQGQLFYDCDLDETLHKIKLGEYEMPIFENATKIRDEWSKEIELPRSSSENKRALLKTMIKDHFGTLRNLGHKLNLPHNVISNFMSGYRAIPMLYVDRIYQMSDGKITKAHWTWVKENDTKKELLLQKIRMTFGRQRDLAVALNVSQQLISKIVVGEKSITKRYLDKINALSPEKFYKEDFVRINHHSFKVAEKEQSKEGE